MKTVLLGNTGLQVPSVVVGCMRFANMPEQEMNHFLHSALEQGAYYFDHADIYGAGACEEVFGRAWAADPSLKREDMVLQSKCGINSRVAYPHYNLSKEYILQAVDGILKRLRTDYLDVLLLHRPDALIEPEEVADAFDILQSSGKVLRFGVSNHKPMQIELLKKYVQQDIIINQLQLSLPVSNMIANGMEVNMTTDGAVDRDGSVLDYARLHDITIQAWSPFQIPNHHQPFFLSVEYANLNRAIEEVAQHYNTTPLTIAAAWLHRHPAKLQILSGSTNPERLRQIIAGGELTLSREEWYYLYRMAGHPLP